MGWGSRQGGQGSGAIRRERRNGREGRAGTRAAIGRRFAIVAGVFLCTVGVVAAGEHAPATGNLPVATEARLAGDEARTRLVVDVSQNIGVTAFTLADPYRVVIDIPQVVFQFPPKTGESGRGLVKAFRYGLVMPGGSRIVIDTKGPVRIEKTFVLDATEDQPARLVLDLVAIDRETFMRTLALENRARRAAEPKKSDREPAKS